jgi:hypothetical protein
MLKWLFVNKKKDSSGKYEGWPEKAFLLCYLFLGNGLSGNLYVVIATKPINKRYHSGFCIIVASLGSTYSEIACRIRAEMGPPPVYGLIIGHLERYNHRHFHSGWGILIPYLSLKFLPYEVGGIMNQGSKNANKPQKLYGLWSLFNKKNNWIYNNRIKSD